MGSIADGRKPVRPAETRDERVDRRLAQIEQILTGEADTNAAQETMRMMVSMVVNEENRAFRVRSMMQALTGAIEGTD